MLMIQPETYSQCVGEVQVLLRDHFEEVESDKEACPLELNHAAYEAAEQIGMLQITTARDDGKLAGYVFFFVQPAMHHASTQVGVMDLFYLTPAHRKGFNAIKLFKAAEQRVADAGARKILCGFKSDHPLHRLFQRLGYRQDEISFSKVV